MPDVEKTKRIIERMEMDYVPDSGVAPEDRRINALEHIAFHVGRIDKKLSDIEVALRVVAQRS
ncbi:MAG: hypothetical protein IIA36_10805 [Proteobacteria bacterium]|nr:hypothetical protein [Pseudomonadota bacterium]